MAEIIKIDIDKALKIYNDNNEDKLTQNELFNRMRYNMDRATANNWKRGQAPKGFAKLMEIAYICGCEMSDIMEIKKI